LIKVLTNTQKTGKDRKKRDLISPRMLLMPVATIRRYATTQLNMMQDITDAVERTLSAAADEAAQLGTKTTAI
jgi:peptidoglycan-N-acetylglucosamine deacetylase